MGYISKEIQFRFIYFLLMCCFYTSYQNLLTQTNTSHYNPLGYINSYNTYYSINKQSRSFKPPRITYFDSQLINIGSPYLITICSFHFQMIYSWLKLTKTKIRIIPHINPIGRTVTKAIGIFTIPIFYKIFC